MILDTPPQKENAEQNNITLAEETYFARIENSNTFFYSAPIDNIESKLFILPNTFFVLLTGNANDENNLFYSAIYMDKNGYVKKNEVKPVSNIPQKPYANNLSFSVFSTSGLELRETPQNTPFNIITEIPYLEKNLIYYGSLEGDEVIPDMTNEWYYCKYINNNSTYFGYLYAGYCYLLPPIPQNAEAVEYINDEIFKQVNLPTTPTQDENAFVSDDLKIVIIIGACLPFLFIIYLLFKPTKIMVDNGNKKPKKKYIFYT